MSRFRFIRKILSDLLLMAIVILYLVFAPYVVYGLRMAKGQLSIVMNARPVSEVLSDAAVPDSVKNRLRLVEEIRRFAFDSIGLKRNDNYTTFYDQQGKRLIYVVTACEPYALKPYNWEFPVLGEVPYKGFFDKARAEKEQQKLKVSGYDTDIGGASGWSTLGWFKDPVLSQMLQYSDGDLAELIIHELTHGTLFVKDSVEYNENLASFIGYKGALWFLESKYGKDSPQYQEYTEGRSFQKSRTDFMLQCARSLDSLYRQMPATWPQERKAKTKTDFYALLKIRAASPSLGADSLFPARFEKRMRTSGNTIFMQYLRYESKQTDFETEYSRFSGLKKYLGWLLTKYGA